jgi:hypothetical protein
MKKIYTGVAAVALAAMLTAAGPSTPAKADGGAVAIGIGAFLLVDALVGRHCRVNEWPFNLIRSVGAGLHGRDSCRGNRRYR